MATGHQSRDDQQPAMSQGASGAESGEGWDALKGNVTEVAGAAVEQGRHFFDSAKAQATGYIDQRKNDAAQTVVGLANSLRESGRAFEGQPGIFGFIESAADGLEQFAETIRSRSAADIFNDVEAALRRRPGTVAATSLVAGFLLARFIKASADGLRDLDQQRRGSDGPERGAAGWRGPARV